MQDSNQRGRSGFRIYDLGQAAVTTSSVLGQGALRLLVCLIVICSPALRPSGTDKTRRPHLK